MTFKPFVDEATSLEVAGLTFENHLDRISVYGQSTITKDQQGLVQALALQAHFNRIVSALKSSTLPPQIEDKPVVIVDNPFL